MAFEIRVVDNTPLSGEKDLGRALEFFLEQIGYISNRGADNGIAYKLFADCLMAYPEKSWLIDELIVHLETSRPTVYRHLNKLKSMDILDETSYLDPDAARSGMRATGMTKKAYRLRYGSLEKAWNFVEAHVKVAMENYARSVEHIQELADARRKGY